MIQRSPLGNGGALASLFAAVLLLAAPVEGASLKGGRASLDRQQKAARQHDYTHLRDRSHVQRFVRSGFLIPIRNTADYRLAGVSYPYARPEVRQFLGELSKDYRAKCGEPLVVTSLTRPESAQPRNASALSVHPTGMAVDLRRSNSHTCRRWIEGRLLALENEGVLEATRENRPPHYHVALFPKTYTTFLAEGGLSKRAGETVKVTRGDTLWDIARRVGTTVAALKQVNGLRSTTIMPGQVLRIP